MKPMLVDLNTLKKIFEENTPGTPVILNKTCIECGCDLTIELHQTSGGFGLQGGVLLELNKQTVAHCLTCHGKLSLELA